MRTNWKCKLLLLTITLVIVLPVLLFSSPAYAGLSIGPAILDEMASYGENSLSSINVGNTGEAPMDIEVAVKGYGQSLDGTTRALDEDTNPYTIVPYLEVSPTTLHLEPGESQYLFLSANVPSEVEASGYAVVLISIVPPPGSQVVIVAAVAVGVRVTVQGSELRHQGEITEIGATEIISGQPIEVLTTFKNTGNHHFKVKGELAISDESGKRLTTIYSPLITTPILPTISQQLQAIFIPEAELAEGTYYVHSKVMLEDGTVLNEAEGSFEIGVPYIPPSPEASIILTPQNPAALETPDGRISISFPQGSVTADVEVAIRTYPHSQLPEPPQDSQLGATCFRVDGMPGLLAKEATLTVKYSADDLALADGDASRLRLARWDEAQRQWSVLDTEVDSEAMTLTSYTNQLGLCTVMVTPPAEPAEVNWPLIGGIVAGVIIVALLVYFLAIRRRGRHS